MVVYAMVNEYRDPLRNFRLRCHSTAAARDETKGSQRTTPLAKGRIAVETTLMISAAKVRFESCS